MPPDLPDFLPSGFPAFRICCLQDLLPHGFAAFEPRLELEITGGFAFCAVKIHGTFMRPGGSQGVHFFRAWTTMIAA
jgi:hypothetical protein